MGSLENGLSLKRDNSQFLRSTSRNNNNERYHQQQSQSPFSQSQRQSRLRFARFLLFKKIDYLLWICTVAVFLFFVVVFQMFLPGSVMEKYGNFLKEREVGSADFVFPKEIKGLDFGEDVKFEPSKLLIKFEKDGRDGNNLSVGSRCGFKESVEIRVSKTPACFGE